MSRFFKIEEGTATDGSIILIDMRSYAGAVVHASATRADTFTLKISLTGAEALYVNVRTAERHRLDEIIMQLHAALLKFNNL